MLQTRHLRQIANDPVLTNRVLGSMFSGPEHNDYYDVSDWFCVALDIMTPDQRLELLNRYENQLEIFDLDPKEFGFKR